MIIVLLWFRPLDSPFAINMEVFNECTMIVLTYGLICFTDFVPEAETRHLVGYAYMGTSLFNIAVHLLFLLCSTCGNCKQWCKRKCCKSKTSVANKVKLSPAPAPTSKDPASKYVLRLKDGGLVEEQVDEGQP